MNNTPNSNSGENANRPDSLLILKQYQLFEKLSPSDYEALTVLDNYREAKPGEFIYFEAFHHQLIYFIKTGHIRLGFLDEAGQRITKDILGPGDFFGRLPWRRQI
jgi:CRP-like cAMP-binding protein